MRFKTDIRPLRLTPTSGLFVFGFVNCFHYTHSTSVFSVTVASHRGQAVGDGMKPRISDGGRRR